MIDNAPDETRVRKFNFKTEEAIRQEKGRFYLNDTGDDALMREETGIFNFFKSTGEN